MKTEKVEVDERFGKEYAGIYVFREMFWAKRNRIIQKHTTYNNVTGEIAKSDFLAIQAESVMASLHGQPSGNPVTLEKLLSEENGISYELGELFSKVVNKLNSVGREDSRFLLEQLDEESRTRLFQSFGFVRSSDGLPQSLPSSLPEQSKNSR